MASPSTTVAPSAGGKAEGAFRINPATLAEKFLTSLGISCILAEPVAGRGDRVRIVVRGVEARKSPHPKLWVRSAKEAEKLSRELMSGCKHASIVRGVIQMATPAAVAIDIVRAFAQLNSIRPIREADLAVTFDSVLARLKKQLDRLQRDGVIRLMRQEYQELALAYIGSPSIVPSTGTSNRGQSGDIRDIRDNTLPQYLDWVVLRLVSQLPAGVDVLNRL